MRKKISAYLFVCLCAWESIDAQTNLVPNPSFDTISQCPLFSGEIYYASPWFQPSTWNGNTTNSSSSEVFNICGTSNYVGIPTNNMGYQYARTGNGYGGIVVDYYSGDYREYIEVPLLSPLISQKKYCVEFYVSLANNHWEAISNMGAYFSVDSVLYMTGWTPLDMYVPQIENPDPNILSDTVNWTLISGSFIASGGEKFLTIGNFHNDSATNSFPLYGGSFPSAYYYIDDVSVTFCDPSEIDENNLFYRINIYPNPASNFIDVETNLKEYSISVFDAMGKLIFKENMTQNKTRIDVSDFPTGIYFIQLQNGENLIGQKFIKQ